MQATDKCVSRRPDRAAEAYAAVQGERMCMQRGCGAARLAAVAIGSILALAMLGAVAQQSQTVAIGGGSQDDQPATLSTATACFPGDVGAAKPAAEYPPMAIAQRVCSQAVLDTLYDACFQAKGNCTAWKTANAGCAQCVFTPDSANVQGPFITRPNERPKANQRGCLDSFAPGCGGAYEAADACTHTACDRNPECRRASNTQRAACRQAAMQTSCAPLMQRFSEKCGVGGLADKRACFPASSDEAAQRHFIAALAKRACGP